MSKLSKFLPNDVKDVIKATVVKVASRWNVPNPHVRSAYSQEGEDLVVARLLGLEQKPRAGFYVDVGAHHPTRFSNTQYFHERGWRGINLDANPGVMAAFNKLRPQDINLEMAIAEEEKTLTFYEFSLPELNGFSKELSESRANCPGFAIISTKLISARPLRSVLDEYLPTGQPIDFMSVDVEGLDMEVVRSNDWQKYRPSLVLVEDATVFTIREASDCTLAHFMRDQGYEFVSKTALTLIFAEMSRIVPGMLGSRFVRS